MIPQKEGKEGHIHTFASLIPQAPELRKGEGGAMVAALGGLALPTSLGAHALFVATLATPRVKLPPAPDSAPARLAPCSRGWPACLRPAVASS